MTTIDRSDYLEVMRCWPSGVSLLTFAGPPAHGLTVSSLVSISANPPVFAVGIGADTAAASYVENGAEVGVSLLAVDQQELSDRFAWLKDEDRFAKGRWLGPEGRPPVLSDAVAWMRGQIRAIHPAGSHLVLLIEPTESALGRPQGSAPLVYWNRGYRSLAIDDCATEA